MKVPLLNSFGACRILLMPMIFETMETITNVKLLLHEGGHLRHFDITRSPVTLGKGDMYYAVRKTEANETGIIKQTENEMLWSGKEITVSE